MYLISLLTSQLQTSSRKVAIKYVGPLVIYKIIDPHNYLLMILDGKILRGLFEHERLKPAIIRTSQGNVCNLSQLKQIVNIGMKIYKHCQFIKLRYIYLCIKLVLKFLLNQFVNIHLHIECAYNHFLFISCKHVYIIA